MPAEIRSLVEDVIVVTGATSGIGAATAAQLVDAGAKVALGARRVDRLDRLVAELGEANAVGIPCDVRRPGDCEDLVAAALAKFGRLTGVVANAGLGAYGGISDHPDEMVSRIIDTNFAGTVWAVRAALPGILASGGGDVVIVSSVAGLRGAANEAVYAGTKFAQVGLAGALDRELRPRGVRVTAICPAGVATEFAMGFGRTPDMPGLDDFLMPEDVAFAVTTVLKQPRRLRTTQWTLWSNAQSS
jgi:NADP-dependent 3-hydroxy acid dehydrogenase YdfG